MKLLLFSLVVFELLDLYWFLPYRNKINYSLGMGWKMRFKIGFGIKFKVITRGDGVPYLVRYTVHTNRWFSVKIHNILESDDACLHDHPWAFISIILRGGYIEETFKDHPPMQRPRITVGEVWRWSLTQKRFKKITAPAILYRSAEHAHRLIVDRPTTTLVITFNKVRAWGFFTPGGWTYWKRYQQENQCE